MNNRSANSAYYASKTELNLNGTKEGLKNPKKPFMYRQKANDVTQSSNKYYAETKTVSVKTAPKTYKVTNLETSDNIVEKLISAFSEGFTGVIVTGNKESLAKNRTQVDMAVGRNVLTREQADEVVFNLVAPVSEEVNKEITTEIKPAKIKTRAKRKKKEIVNETPFEDSDSKLGSESSPVSEKDIAEFFQPELDSDDE